MDATDLIRDLGRRLDEATPGFDRLDRYLTGAQPLAFLAPEVRAAVAGRLEPLAVNWPRLVVAAVEERLDVEGFRLAAEQPDDELWRIWQANGLDEGSQLAHEAALVHGRAYVIVWAGDDPATPRITVESARQVYLAHEPGTTTPSAALKRWTADGYAYATLYERDRITRWRSRGRVPDAGDTSYVPAGGWAQRGETVGNPLGVVPVVALVNRPRLLAPLGESELTDVLPIADAVNKLATDMMVSSEFHAIPRRWATGIELPTDDEGEVDTAAATSPVAGRTWFFEDPETRVGQFAEANLGAFVEAIGMLTRHVAALAGLPPHYLLVNVDQPASADAIRSSEASLVAKARRKQRALGGAWEQVMRLALLVRDGVEHADVERMETVWRDPETRTVAQAADAAVKLVGAGIIPAQQAQEDIGYSPVQQDRMRVQRRQAALDGAGVAFDGLLS